MARTVSSYYLCSVRYEELGSYRILLGTYLVVVRSKCRYLVPPFAPVSCTQSAVHTTTRYLPTRYHAESIWCVKGSLRLAQTPCPCSMEVNLSTEHARLRGHPSYGIHVPLISPPYLSPPLNGPNCTRQGPCFESHYQVLQER